MRIRSPCSMVLRLTLVPLTEVPLWLSRSAISKTPLESSRDRAMLSRNRRVAHLHLVGGIPPQKQRAIRFAPRPFPSDKPEVATSLALRQVCLRWFSVAESAAEASSNGLTARPGTNRLPRYPFGYRFAPQSSRAARPLCYCKFRKIAPKRTAFAFGREHAIGECVNASFQ